MAALAHVRQAVMHLNFHFCDMSSMTGLLHRAEESGYSKILKGQAQFNGDHNATEGEKDDVCLKK